MEMFSAGKTVGRRSDISESEDRSVHTKNRSVAKSTNSVKPGQFFFHGTAHLKPVGYLSDLVGVKFEITSVENPVGWM